MSHKPPNSSPPVDILVVGAGPAGLSVATGVARLVHTCIVFSSKVFRNQGSHHMHAVPGWDHRDPAEFRNKIKTDILTRYNTISFEDVEIRSVRKSQRGDGTSLFQAIDENGTEWWGRKVVLATGITDMLLDIDGYRDCWITGIFHCLFCHGYEERGSSSAGVLAVGDFSSAKFSLHIARQASQLAQKVTIYTNGNDAATKEIEEALHQCNPTSKARQSISVDNTKITRFVKSAEGAQLDVVLEDGRTKREGFLVHKPEARLNGPWVEQLGLEKTEQGQIKVTAPFNETSVPGVFAVGDCGTPVQSVANAIAAGGLTAGGVTAQCEEED